MWISFFIIIFSFNLILGCKLINRCDSERIFKCVRKKFFWIRSVFNVRQHGVEIFHNLEIRLWVLLLFFFFNKHQYSVV
jgi:hypothetical protein